MNGSRSSLGGILRARAALAVFVAIVWGGVPGVLSNGEAAEHAKSGEPTGLMRAVRRVQVHRLWCEPGTESDAGAGLSLYAHLEAVGLRWQSVLVEIRLRTPDGKPVRATKSAPEGYADDQGRFFMGVRLPVFDDRFEWQALRASIPVEKVLDLPAERPRRLIATFRASCEGLSSVSEAEITIAPDKAPRLKRALSVLAIDPFADGPPPDDPSAEHAARNDGPPRPAARQRGLMVEGYVEAQGLGGSKLVGKLAVRADEGKPLLRKDPKTRAEKPVEHSVPSKVVAGQAQFLLHFLPYDTLRLEPGGHRLIFAYRAQCDGLTASLEEAHVVGVPAPGE